MCLSITILLEVLLVRSVPCRLGISSDIALSCCLSFANLSGENLNIQKRTKKKGHAPANEYLDLILQLSDGMDVFAHTGWHTDLANGSN